MSTGVRSGVLLAVIGLWMLMRATHQDDSGRTLIDHILSKPASFKYPKGSPQNPINATPSSNPASLPAPSPRSYPSGTSGATRVAAGPGPISPHPLAGGPARVHG